MYLTPKSEIGSSTLPFREVGGSVITLCCIVGELWQPRHLGVGGNRPAWKGKNTLDKHLWIIRRGKNSCQRFEWSNQNWIILGEQTSKFMVLSLQVIWLPDLYKWFLDGFCGYHCDSTIQKFPTKNQHLNLFGEVLKGNCSKRKTWKLQDSLSTLAWLCMYLSIHYIYDQ